LPSSRGDFTSARISAAATLHQRIDFPAALLRWSPWRREPVSPAEFIAVAEDCGLILPIAQWVLREACRQARTWTNAGLRPAMMAVNIDTRCKSSLHSCWDMGMILMKNLS
jgi:EAL domain-containing protein (putative c-di-GMP-specific phosphodiesterase class I)